MDTITLRVGSATQNPGPKRLQEIDDLAEHLREAGHSVTVEQEERIPGRYGVIWAETVAIFIGSAAGSGIVSAVVTDVYNTAKSWARSQFKRKKEANPGGRIRTQSFTLYDSEGKPLLSWKVSDEGDNETIYEISSTADQGDKADAGD